MISISNFFDVKEGIMKKNMGAADRIIRTVLAVVVAVLYLTNQISGTAAIILGIIAIIFLLTSLVGFCPLYVPFKLSTLKKE
jgi:hypothetical protein